MGSSWDHHGIINGLLRDYHGDYDGDCQGVYHGDYHLDYHGVYCGVYHGVDHEVHNGDITGISWRYHRDITWILEVVLEQLDVLSLRIFACTVSFALYSSLFYI